MTNGHESGGAGTIRQPSKIPAKEANAKQVTPPEKQPRNQKASERHGGEVLHVVHGCPAQAGR